MPLRIAVDARGEYAPDAIVRGAVRAILDDPDLEVVLVGDETRIARALRCSAVHDLAVCNAVKAAKRFVEQGVNEAIAAQLQCPHP